MKTALITGATDGIGKALALRLAQDGYSLHIIGRNEERGVAAINSLNKIAPQGHHQFFAVDLASIAANKAFLAEYKQTYKQLDLLILNANAVSKKLSLSADGVETTFAVGFVSRYLFSIALEPLLTAATKDSRVVHIGDARAAKKLNPEPIFCNNYGIAKATLHSYSADSVLAYGINTFGHSNIPHEVYMPGMVRTKQLDVYGSLIGTISRWFAKEPETVADIFATHLKNTRAKDAWASYFNEGKKGKMGKTVTNEQEWQKVIGVAQRITGVCLNANTW